MDVFELDDHKQERNAKGEPDLVNGALDVDGFVVSNVKLDSDGKGGRDEIMDARTGPATGADRTEWMSTVSGRVENTG